MTNQNQKQPKPAEPVTLPIINCRFVERGLERLGYEVRVIAAGFDGQRKWVAHKRDPSTGTHYNERSYFNGGQLLALASHKSKQEIRDSIVAAEAVKLKYIKIRGENSVTKKNGTKKTTAADERAAREARSASKATKAPAAKAGKGTQAASKKNASKKAASKNGNGKASDIDLSDPDVKLLASYQEKTTTERMTAANMVNLYKRIKAATYDTPVVNTKLNAYDKRQARELARLGLVAKDRIPDVGLGYFAK